MTWKGAVQERESFVEPIDDIILQLGYAVAHIEVCH